MSQGKSKMFDVQPILSNVQSHWRLKRSHVPLKKESKVSVSPVVNTKCSKQDSPHPSSRHFAPPTIDPPPSPPSLCHESLWVRQVTTTYCRPMFTAEWSSDQVKFPPNFYNLFNTLRIREFKVKWTKISAFFLSIWL